MTRKHINMGKSRKSKRKSPPPCIIPRNASFLPASCDAHAMQSVFRRMYLGNRSARLAVPAAASVHFHQIGTSIADARRVGWMDATCPPGSAQPEPWAPWCSWVAWLLGEPRSSPPRTCEPVPQGDVFLPIPTAEWMPLTRPAERNEKSSCATAATTAGPPGHPLRSIYSTRTPPYAVFAFPDIQLGSAFQPRAFGPSGVLPKFSSRSSRILSALRDR